jgi:hypothetical protein
VLSSSQVAPDSFEIWLWALGGHAWHVEECGSFGLEDHAERVAGLVNDWLHYGRWPAELTAEMPEENDRISLFALPDVLKSQGIDPTLVSVEAGPSDDLDTKYCSGGPGETATWANPAVRPDAGSVPRGPHEVVRVKAKRR